MKAVQLVQRVLASLEQGRPKVLGLALAGLDGQALAERSVLGLLSVTQ